MKKYSKQKLVAIEKKYLHAIKTVKRAGLKIVQDDWGLDLVNGKDIFPKRNSKIVWENKNGFCCPNGAICLVYQPKFHIKKEKALKSDLNKMNFSLEKELKVSFKFLNGFNHGFDSISNYGPDSFEELISLEPSEEIFEIHHCQGYEMGRKIAKLIFNVK